MSEPENQSRVGPTRAASPPSITNLIVSSILSLAIVLVLLVCLRFLLPPMLEWSRYSWHRGQLRAEYEVAGQQLERVSLEGITQISRTVSRRVGPSVVHIMMRERRESNAGDGLEGDSNELEPRRTPPNGFGQRSEFRHSGQGSGIVVDDDGFILTNYHVLEGGSEIQVCVSDERCFKGTIVGIDRITDLALIKIDCDELLPITWGDSEDIEVGSPVWAVGSPFGLVGSVSFGIISGKHRQDLKASASIHDPIERPASRYRDLIQSDVAVNPGNSGGPLVNSRGEMIGINTAIIGESYQGVSFAIPSNFAKGIYQQLKKAGEVQRGWLGVELAQKDADVEGASVSHGAVIRNVVIGSPAHRAELRVGDVILSMNGNAFRSIEELIYRIGGSRVGSTVRFMIQRDEAELEKEITLGTLPAYLK